jgi:hypothetical protein
VSFAGGNSRVRFGIRGLVDLVLDGSQAVTGVNRRLDRLSSQTPRMEVVVLGIYQHGSIAAQAVERLSHSKHSVTFALGCLDSTPAEGLESSTLLTAMQGNKFENINKLLAVLDRPDPPRWTLLLDDDVVFPRRFLDRFLALCEHFDLRLAQPAMSRRSHASYRVTRRQPASLVRETRFVEGGQLTAIRDEAARELLPFPADADMWGLDLHWAGLAQDRGWPIGVVDATPVRHDFRPTGQTYSTGDAARHGHDFVRQHRAISPEEADQTVEVHRALRSVTPSA